MSQVSKYILSEPAEALQVNIKDMFAQATQIIGLVADDAEPLFYHGTHIVLEFDDFSTVVVSDTDFIVRLGEDIEVFSADDFHELFIRLG